MSLSINCPTTDKTIQSSLPVYTIAESDLINNSLKLMDELSLDRVKIKILEEENLRLKENFNLAYSTTADFKTKLQRVQENAVVVKPLYEDYKSTIIESERDFKNFSDRVHIEYTENLDFSLPRSY